MHFMNSTNSQRPYKLELCLLAIITVVIQDMYFLVNGLNENAHYLHTALDHVIPLIKWFAIPYIWYYFYLVGVLIWFAFRNTAAYYKLLFARIAGIVVCFIIYIIFPTATIRPEIVGNDILSELVRTIYIVDKDYNCLPSTHCLDTLITSLFLLKYERGWMLRGLSVVSLVPDHRIPQAACACEFGCIHGSRNNFVRHLPETELCHISGNTQGVLPVGEVIERRSRGGKQITALFISIEPDGLHL